MFGRVILTVLLVSSCILVSCDDNGINPGDLKFSGITTTDEVGEIMSFDPDDWCYGEIVLNNELVYLAPRLELYADDTGTIAQASFLLFNYSDEDITIQLESKDSLVGFVQRSISIGSNTWREVPIQYRAYSYEPHQVELALPVTPQGDTFHLPVIGYAGLIIDLPVTLQQGFFNPYPNPCTHITTLRFSMPNAGHVRLDIRGPDYYLTGGETLIDEDMPAGWHEVEWNLGADPDTGVYRAYITADDFQCYGDIKVEADAIHWQNGSR